MTPYDWIIVFFGVGLIVLFTVERMLRALLGLAIFWAATLLSAIGYEYVTFLLQAVVGRNVVLARGIVFDTLLLLAFLVGYIIIRVAFPVTKLPKLGILDNLMGFLLGCSIAILFLALLVNSLGVMVVEYWESNPDGWAMLRYQYLSSGLRPYTSPILKGYSMLFTIFFRGLPPVLVPQ